MCVGMCPARAEAFPFLSIFIANFWITYSVGTYRGGMYARYVCAVRMCGMYVGLRTPRLYRPITTRTRPLRPLSPSSSPVCGVREHTGEQSGEQCGEQCGETRCGNNVWKQCVDAWGVWKSGKCVCVYAQFTRSVIHRAPFRRLAHYPPLAQTTRSTLLNSPLTAPTH